MRTGAVLVLLTGIGAGLFGFAQWQVSTVDICTEYLSRMQLQRPWGVEDVGGIAVALIWSAGMVLVMMSAGLYRPISHVIYQSLPRRTVIQVGAFVLTYVMLWMPIIMAMHIVGGVIFAYSPPTVWTALIAVAGWYIWTCTPVHQLALNRCHLTQSIRSFGIAAIKDSVGFAAKHVAWCITSCWPLMLVPIAVGHADALAMVGPAIIGTLMRLLPPRQSRWRATGFLPVWNAVLVISRWCAVRFWSLGLSIR